MVVSCYSGQPVAWMISDREDHTVVQELLSKMKERSPDVRVNAIMTDDGTNNT